MVQDGGLFYGKSCFLSYNYIKYNNLNGCVYKLKNHCILSIPYNFYHDTGQTFLTLQRVVGWLIWVLTSHQHREMGSQFIVSSDRLEKPRIKPTIPGLQGE